MNLRPATPADGTAIAALEARLFGTDAWSAATVERSLVTDRVLVAGDAPVGYVVVSVAGELADLQRIAVDPAHRRRGVAGSLLRQATRDAGDSGAQRMLLEVRADSSAALAFYVAEGFAEIDRRRRYYRDGADAIVMELPLRQGR
jgi:ribosomal-protein-alanine N-acetyltransferase